MSLKLWRAANHRVFEDFVSELSQHLGRSVRDVKRTGILATEFPYQWVRVYYGEDRKGADSVCDFGFAFPIISRRKQAIAVFAQNAGYFVFNHLCVVAVRSRKDAKRERVVWNREHWWQE
jgi:hypothetical protein